MPSTNDDTPPADGGQPAKPSSAEKTRHRAGSAKAPAILSQTPNLLNLLLCLRRRLVVALTLGVFLGCLAGVGAWFFVPPPKHQVKTLLRVPAGSFYVVRTSEVIPDLSMHQRNQVALARSRLVLTTALRDPAVSNSSLIADSIDPVDWLEKEVAVDFSVAPEIMRISMNGMETDDLVVLVNALRKAFLSEVVDRDKLIRTERRDYLHRLVEKYDDQLKGWREAQKSTDELLGSRNSDVRARILSFTQQQLGMIEHELLLAESGSRQAGLALAELKEREKHFQKSKVPEAAIAEALTKEEEILTVKAEIRRLEKRIAATLQRSVQEEADPTVVRDRKEVRQLERKVREAGDRLRPKIIEKLQEQARVDLQTGLAIQQARISNLEGTKQLLGPTVKDLRDKVVAMSKQGIKLDASREEITHVEDMMKRLKNEHEALKVELEAPTRVVLLEEATVTRVRSESRKMMMTGGAFAGAFCFALFGVGWLEYRARRIHKVDEVVFGLGMRLVGTVPKVAKLPRTTPGKPGKASGDGHQVLTESVDAARTLLLHLARTQGLRSVMVTSAVAGEGKTSLSCRLAFSLARAGLRTLLVDADTRNPSVHTIFGGPCEPGFCEALCGQTDPRSSLRPTPLANLLFMPAGRWSEQLPAVLDQGGASVLFKQFQQEFDIILVDSPPVLPVADALQIGQHVDGVLLSVLCHVSRLNNVYEVSRRLEELNIRTLGVVVNGVQGQLYGAKYKYPHPSKPQAQAQAQA